MGRRISPVSSWFSSCCFVYSGYPQFPQSSFPGAGEKGTQAPSAFHGRNAAGFPGLSTGLSRSQIGSRRDEVGSSSCLLKRNPHDKRWLCYKRNFLPPPSYLLPRELECPFIHPSWTITNVESNMLIVQRPMSDKLHLNSALCTLNSTSKVKVSF